MTAILLILNIIVGVIQQVARKESNKRQQGGVYSFSAAAAFLSLVFFSIRSGGNWNATGQTFSYAIIFSTAFAVTTITTMLAIQCGPLSLTSLVVSYSLVIPALYGIIFLQEPISLRLVLGIILLFVSIFLINREEGEQKKINLRWGIFAIITFFGNGICTTAQKLYQVRSGGSTECEFMMISMSIVVGVLLIAAIICEGKQLFKNLKEGAIWYGICGLGNASSNSLTMILALSMPASVLYPLLSAGGIVLTALISRIFYREKLSTPQKIGLVLGIAATIALS